MYNLLLQRAYSRRHTFGMWPLAKPMNRIWAPHLTHFKASLNAVPPTGSNTTSMPLGAAACRQLISIRLLDILVGSLCLLLSMETLKSLKDNALHLPDRSDGLLDAFQSQVHEVRFGLQLFLIRVRPKSFAGSTSMQA